MDPPDTVTCPRLKTDNWTIPACGTKIKLVKASTGKTVTFPISEGACNIYTFEIKSGQKRWFEWFI